MLGAMTAHAWHSDEYMKVKGKKQVKKGRNNKKLSKRKVMEQLIEMRKNYKLMDEAAEGGECIIKVNEVIAIMMKIIIIVIIIIIIFSG